MKYVTFDYAALQEQNSAGDQWMEVVLHTPTNITTHERHAKLSSMHTYSRLLGEGK